MSLLTGTVPANKSLLTGTVFRSITSFYMDISYMDISYLCVLTFCADNYNTCIKCLYIFNIPEFIFITVQQVHMEWAPSESGVYDSEPRGIKMIETPICLHSFHWLNLNNIIARYQGRMLQLHSLVM